MLTRIFPRQFDNTYRGHWLGTVLLAVIAVGKAGQGVKSILDARATAIGADGIPLDSFGIPAADTVLSLFVLLGFYVTIVPLQSAVVLIRYRSMIPLMYIWLLFAQLGSRILGVLRPAQLSRPMTIGVADHPIGFFVNIAVLAVTVIGFGLSLRDGEKSINRKRII